MGRGVNEELERRIRVFCNDPEATDVSSDEGDDVVARTKRKKMVVEICLPSPVLAVPSTPRVSRNGTPSTRKVRRVGVAPTKKGGVGGGRSRSSVAAKGSATKMRGVRQRKWGKWAAEIRDPIRRIRLWLGTYDTPEEAAVAYQREAMRLEAEKNAISSSSSTSVAAAAAAAVSSTSDNSEAQQPTISSPSSVLELSKGSGLKMVAEEEAKASPPPPPLLPPVLPLDMDFGFEVDSFLDNSQLGGEPIPTTFGAFDEFPSSFCIDDGGQEEGSFDDFRLGDVLDFDFDPISSWVDEANPLVSVTTTTSSFADY